MRLATSEHIFNRQGVRAPYSLRIALERGVRPAVGFQSPDDVVKDPHLTLGDKREILSSWASDASAVQDEPRLRWLLGTVEPVPWDEVQAALRRLDAIEAGRGDGARQDLERGVRPPLPPGGGGGGPGDLTASF